MKCQQCQQQITGRADKKFCSLICKNKFNQHLKRQTQNNVIKIDKILHRNYHILNTLMGEKRNKMMIPRLDLEAMGFSFKYITGIYTNTQGKTYFYVYEFAWMEFSSQEIMLVKNKQKPII